MNESEMLQRALACVRERIAFVPETAIVLGSGLEGVLEKLRIEAELPFGEIDGFPVSTVPGHRGSFVFGYVDEIPVVCMNGRVHYYEGYSMQEVVRPIRLMKLLGAKTLILTNAAGGIQLGMQPGDLMLITGQIASFVPSPLIGRNLDELGPRFPDMSEIYNTDLIFEAKNCAANLGIDLKVGTYLQLPGPQYETPQEIAMCRRLGADAVGMSTACEAVAANHMGMRIAGIALICNLASGISPNPLSHEEVQKCADEGAPRLGALVLELVRRSVEPSCR